MITIKHRLISERDVPYTILYSDEPQRSLFFDMWARCHRSKNFTFTTTNGIQGSGKSYGNIYMGWMLDVDAKTEEHLFTNENVIFDPIEFVEKARTPDHKGVALMKDEIEMDANSRDMFSRLTKIIGNVISTVRYKQEIIFFNLPLEKQLENRIREMRYGNFEFKGVDPSGDFSKFKFENLKYPNKADTNNKWDKMIKRDILNINHVVGNNFYNVQYVDLKLKLPFHIKSFANILKDYDKRKDEYLNGKFEDYVSELKKLQRDDKKNSFQLFDMIDMIEKNKDKFIINGNLSIAEIQRHFGVSNTQCQMIVREYKGRNGVGKQKAQKKKEREEFLKTIKKSKSKLKDLVERYNI